VDRVELNRLRWHCRRGMLENDLMLERFMDRHGEGLEGARLEAFRRLLELSDGELWDLISGRRQAADPRIEEVLRLIRDQ
jgi:succinate dehydrogenase flavin-adding protein (antitoxin of CptAB toxin-antitoxin module)